MSKIHLILGDIPMSSTRLFFKPFVVLFALALTATEGAPSNLDAKGSLQKAADKAYDMWVLLDKGDLEAAIPVAEATMAYTETAYRELSALAEKDGSYNSSYRHAADALDWLKQTIKDAKAKETREAFSHGNKARGSLNHALDEFPKS
jgi:hypothetical protein